MNDAMRTLLVLAAVTALAPTARAQPAGAPNALRHDAEEHGCLQGKLEALEQQCSENKADPTRSSALNQVHTIGVLCTRSFDDVFKASVASCQADAPPRQDLLTVQLQASL